MFQFKVVSNFELNSGLPSLTQSVWDICSWHSFYTTRAFSHANISASFSSHSFIFFKLRRAGVQSGKKPHVCALSVNAGIICSLNGKRASTIILQCTFWMVQLALKKSIIRFFSQMSVNRTACSKSTVVKSIGCQRHVLKLCVCCVNANNFNKRSARYSQYIRPTPPLCQMQTFKVG